MGDVGLMPYVHACIKLYRYDCLGVHKQLYAQHGLLSVVHGVAVGTGGYAGQLGFSLLV